MKVILLQEVENLGKKYEVKEVKSGYARNFLIPQNFAKPANKENMKWLATQKEFLEKEVEEDLKRVQDVASHIDGVEVAITVKVGPEGQLFESINNVKIAEKLKELGFDVKKSHIKLEEPIKELGEFPVKDTLEHNLEAEINVIISGEKAEEKEVE